MPYIHPSSVITGNVTLGRDVSVWPGAVLRGDIDSIVIGDETNVQDGVIIHVDYGVPVRVGSRVTIGHRAVIHGCTIEDDCLIGMGAVVLNGALIGTGSMVAAGAVVLEGARIPPGSLVAGVPGKVRRELTADEHLAVVRNATHYVDLTAAHRAALGG